MSLRCTSLYARVSCSTSHHHHLCLGSKVVNRLFRTIIHHTTPGFTVSKILRTTVYVTNWNKKNRRSKTVRGALNSHTPHGVKGEVRAPKIRGLPQSGENSSPRTRALFVLRYGTLALIKGKGGAKRERNRDF